MGTDPDTGPAPDPALFVTNLQDAAKKYLFSLHLCSFSFECTLHYSSKIKSHKEFTKTVEIKIFLHFCLYMEESGAGSEATSRSIQINYGSGFGSRRSKNIRIRLRDPDPGTLLKAKRTGTTCPRPLFGQKLSSSMVFPPTKLFCFIMLLFKGD
jgi:hypothetical protein